MRYSVITINFNNRDGLRRTIESVVNQTYLDYEYIIIDGGSTDGSVDVIREYADKITYWVSERDKGIYNAMNKGVEQAHGDYCIFMNSGDCFYDQEVLEKAAKYDEDIFVGKVVDNDNQEWFVHPARDVSLYFLYTSTIAHQGSFIRTELLRSYPYDEHLRIVADWKFFVEAIILQNCSFRFVDNMVARFDTSGVSTSNTDATWKEKEQALMEMFPSRVVADLKYMKSAECLTQTLTPQLRKNYRIDKFLFRLGRSLLKITSSYHPN